MFLSSFLRAESMRYTLSFIFIFTNPLSVISYLTLASSQRLRIALPVWLNWVGFDHIFGFRIWTSPGQKGTVMLIFC
jgi:hypothetical protein